MNPVTIKEGKKIFSAIKKGVNFKNTEVVICPPFLYLALRSFNKGGATLGAQNSFWENEGAFTGEISPLMIKNLGVEYVILGHSERREYLLENNSRLLFQKQNRLWNWHWFYFLFSSKNKISVS